MRGPAGHATTVVIMVRSPKSRAGSWFIPDIGLGVLGILMPCAIWQGGLWIFGIPLQPSISDYYHTPIGSLHVGALLTFAVYFVVRPWSTKKSRIAGVLIGLFTAGAALVPVPQCLETAGSMVRAQEISGLIHLLFAFLLLCTFAYLTFFRFGMSADDPELVAGRIRNVHRMLGTVMLFCSLLIGAIGLSGDTCHSDESTSSDVFWLEAAALSAFWLSWLIECLWVRRDETALRSGI